MLAQIWNNPPVEVATALALVALPAVLLGLSCLWGDQRAKALRQFAESRGLQFTRRDQVGLAGLLAGCAQADRPGSRHILLNLCSGTFAGQPMVLFDHHFLERPGQPGSGLLTQTVLAIPCPASCQNCGCPDKDSAAAPMASASGTSAARAAELFASPHRRQARWQIVSGMFLYFQPDVIIRVDRLDEFVAEGFREFERLAKTGSG